MATDTPKGMVRFFDDFLGDTINLDYYIVSSDAGGTAFAVNDQANGCVRGSVDTDDNDLTQLITDVQWKASNGGPLTLEVRSKPVTSVADGETYIGFSDSTADENPMLVSTTDVLTSNASDAAGFCYTGAGTANWKAVAVKGDADNAGGVITCNKGGATTPVVGTYQTHKIVVNEAGDADFFINGIFQGRADNAVTAGTLLNMYVCIQSGTTARSWDVDYIEIIGGRV